VGAVSIATSPRHVVVVQNYSRTISDMGTPKNAEPDGPPVTVRCNVYPLSSDESVSLGLINDETRRVYLHFTTWPGNQHSTITFDGALWEQVGPVVTYDSGFATKHSQVVLRKRGSLGRADP
jgi:hypothetical protein